MAEFLVLFGFPLACIRQEMSQYRTYNVAHDLLKGDLYHDEYNKNCYSLGHIVYLGVICVDNTKIKEMIVPVFESIA